MHKFCGNSDKKEHVKTCLCACGRVFHFTLSTVCVQRLAFDLGMVHEFVVIMKYDVQ